MTLQTNDAKQIPKHRARKFEQFTALELNGVAAELKNGVWYSSDPIFAARLNLMSGLIEYSASDPHPDATVARGIAARLGAQLLHLGVAPKRSEHRMY